MLKYKDLNIWHKPKHNSEDSHRTTCNAGKDQT